MSGGAARDELLESLLPWNRRPAPGEVDACNALIDAFAHELAERIRNSEVLWSYTDGHMGDCNRAADLIDPAVAP